MKQVWVLRHGDWVQQTDTLTERAEARCLSLRNRIGPFAIAIASPFDRTVETARLITGQQPRIDERAGMPHLTSEETARLLQLATEHSLGRAGVLFSTPAFLPRVKQAGERLIELINETLASLADGEKALVVTHEGTLCAASKLLKDESFSSLTTTYYEFEGFIVNEEGLEREFIYRKDGEL